jgi:3-methylfumaryl-CoA hydratase
VAPAPDDEAWDWELALPTGPTLLFRYSALTYNAHRIHYDRRYATEEEGYPGLVVHGPLQATAAAELCRRYVPERKLRSFRFRAVRPAFDGPTLRVVGRLEADGENVTLAVLDHEGHKTVEAAATLEAAP